ncbi:MAG: Spermidine/putrescine import ATP-binding protein PotA [Paracidovorax wautersii]|uniref:Spermidine/putrescine import ATP-binding protein PotA n=1 Tax=Paracidovorax wautersii TaxID=1177982 RepID=A0A7V8JRV2_9BURK|nr:MAG: Spermidine/putrescine import ATP-binding protein PotA [Paracidovorax wautersii]
MADRLVIMNQGRIEQIGTPGQVYEHPANRFVAEFMGKTNFLEGQTTTDGRFQCKSGEVLACAETPEREGVPRVMSFRPERVRLSRGAAAAGAGWNGLRGRMLSTTYLGPFIEHRIGVAGDAVLTALQPNGREQAEQALAGGDEVLVEWPVQDSRLLRD